MKTAIETTEQVEGPVVNISCTVLPALHQALGTKLDHETYFESTNTWTKRTPALLYGSLLPENQRRMQHMDSAVRRLDRTSEELVLRRNVLRQEEITEEIEIIVLSVAALK